jgi:NAD-dependent deacetylase
MGVSQQDIRDAADIIRQAKHLTAFTGAGISVESGIHPFRGEGGLWDKYDPMLLDIQYFLEHPDRSWKVIKEIFYDTFGNAEPNRAHQVLAEMEKSGRLKEIITQNIDNLHQEAGNTVVHEFHGNSTKLICTKTGEILEAKYADLDATPPMHPATGGLLKPDFIFFGEGIPAEAYQASIEAARNSDVFIVIGTTGEIMPASQIPHLAKENGAKIIEVNTKPSNYTDNITDIFLQGKATEVMGLLSEALNS